MWTSSVCPEILQRLIHNVSCFLVPILHVNTKQQIVWINHDPFLGCRPKQTHENIKNWKFICWIYFRKKMLCMKRNRHIWNSLAQQSANCNFTILLQTTKSCTILGEILRWKLEFGWENVYLVNGIVLIAFEKENLKIGSYFSVLGQVEQFLHFLLHLQK